MLKIEMTEAEAWSWKMLSVMRTVDDGLAELGWKQPGWCGVCLAALQNEFWFCDHCRDRKELDKHATRLLPR